VRFNEKFWSRAGVVLLTLIVVLAQAGYCPVLGVSAPSEFVILMEIGKSDSGQPICREVSLDDPAAADLYGFIKGDPGIQNAVDTFHRVQVEKQERDLQELRAAGLSEEEIAVVRNSTPIHPAYFVIDSTGEVNSASVRGFELADGRGDRQPMPDVPLVHVAVNSPTMQSGNITRQVRSLAHELGHCMMGVLYEGAENFPQSDYLGKSHWRGKVTAPGLAMIEGWAEFTGPYFSGDESKIVSIDAGDFAFNEDSGELKSHSEMMATEGVIASIFWDMMKSDSGLQDPWIKIGTVFQKHRPETMEDFERAFLTEYPADAEAMYDIMCRNTFMASVSGEAAQKYRDFMEGRISRAEYVAWLKDAKESGWQEYQGRYVTRRAPTTPYDWKVGTIRTRDGREKYDTTIIQDGADVKSGGYEMYLEMLNKNFGDEKRVPAPIITPNGRRDKGSVSEE